jgi:uncharacterized membrane protein
MKGLSIIGMILFIVAISAMSMRCNSNNSRIDKVENKSIENVTSSYILSVIDKNVSCTAFAAFVLSQQAAKGSDQNLASSIVNTCTTIFINQDCKNWEDYKYSTQQECRQFHQTRK